MFAGALPAQTTLYVATTGNDANPGTIDLPLATIARAITLATVPGTTIYVRGGTYALSATITISRSGTSTSMYRLLAYQNERPFLNFSAMPIGSNNRGIRLSGSYWDIKGFHLWKAGDNGMNISGSNNTIENCTFSENADTGLQLGGGASNNRIINCDSYFNTDPGQGNADGFAPKLDVGTGNYFYGCRAWQNSDDGWDGYIRPRPAVVPTTTLENCWTFMNGYLMNGLPSSGNGNGFKMGGSDSANLSHDVILKNCLAFQNRVKGFDQNNDRGSMTLYNCTAYSNGTNFGMSGTIDLGSVMALKNCISAGTGAVNLNSSAVQATNSWMPPFIVTDADFVSVDTTGVRGARNADGSLPNIAFMHLAPGSDLIDAGTNVGLPFNGSAPDLGCFETPGPSAIANEISSAGSFVLEQNYPNPFNPETRISFSVERSERTTLSLYNMLGQHVLSLFDDVAQSGQVYMVKLDGRKLSSGVYFYRLQSGNRSALKKLILLK
jgi:parallel beta-helix repeat protein